MTKIYLIRHGETILNVQNKISGQIETDLTELGKKQARECALDLKKKGVEFDVILCSTLKRAKDTAAIISNVLPAPIVYDENLQEFSNGIFEGVQIDDLKKMHFEPPYETAGFKFENGSDLVSAYSSFDTKYDQFSYPQGETKEAARDRFMVAIKKYLDNHTQIKKLAVIAHGGVIRFTLLKVCPETLKEKIKNAEARLILYNQNQGFYI